MDLSFSDELELFFQELQQHMSSHALEQLARDIGFVQRRSKYRAQDLVALCVWLSQLRLSMHGFVIKRIYQQKSEH